MSTSPPSIHLSPIKDTPSSSFSSLSSILKSRFELCRQTNILRTDPLAPNVLRRKIFGNYHFITEYEPSLIQNKRSATISPHVPMNEPFNPHSFNFNQVNDDEILAHVVDEDNAVHPILVNVSPLMYGHGLLIPHPTKCYPQQLRCDTIQIIIQLMKKRKFDYCIGFNSLNAFSSVNHLHCHILFPSELDHEDRGKGEALMDGRVNFPIAYASLERNISGNYHGCRVDLVQWFIPCFSFTCVHEENEEDVCLQNATFQFISFLHEKKIPHNVLFLIDDYDQENNAIRCIIIPRKPQHYFDKSLHGFNAALGEISGMIIARTEQDYYNFTEESLVEIMKEYVACEEEVLKDVYLELSK